MKKILKFDIEKWLLGNLTRLSIYLILLLLIIQITYFIGGSQFLEIDKLITIIGAILVFWYGYKKYERDKEIQILENFLLSIDDNISYKKVILIWSTAYELNKNAYLNDDYFNKIELHCSELYVTNILKEELDESIGLDISTILLYFNKSEYIKNQLRTMRTFWQNDNNKTKNGDTFINVLNYIENKNWGEKHSPNPPGQ